MINTNKIKDICGRRSASWLFVAAVLTACASSFIPRCSWADTAGVKPNVLLIMTDDQGWGDISSHHNPVLSTPNLDELAASGARFDRFYVSPVCAPTRAALLTGRWHPRTGVSGVTRGEETMRASERTMAEIFRDAGYRTGAFGKWHNGAHFPHDSNGQGFDAFVGFSAGHWDFYFDSPMMKNQQPIQGEGFIIDDLTDRAIEFIEAVGTADNSQPWLCYVPYNTPHSPWQVPDKYWDKYQSYDLEPTTACAYAMVENIDDNIGRILRTLDDSNQSNDTIVLFLTDNGANTDRFNDGMRGRKASLHEGGSRVPLFIRYPDVVPTGTVVTDLAAHIDLLPTLMEWSQIEQTGGQPLDGISLVDAMTNRDPTGGDSTGGDSLNDRLLFNVWNGRGAVRSPKWRLVNESPNRPRWQLYDMIDDPSQTKDVATQFPDVVTELSEAYASWWADVSKSGFDPIPTEIGHPEATTIRLPGHEAILSGEAISYHGTNGWANDWIDHWTGADSSPSWPVRVIEAGRYNVRIEYTAGESAVGSELVLQANEARLSWTLDKPHQPVEIETRDRIPRKEVTPQTWAKISVGAIDLPSGEFRLVLRRMSDGAPIQVKSVELSRDSL